MLKFNAAVRSVALVTALAMGAAPAAMAASISGAGATFPAPVYAKWAEAYKAQTHNDLNYQAISNLKDQEVQDFATRMQANTAT